MPIASPFVHAWVLPADIAESVWRPLHVDAMAVLTAASHQLERGRGGEALAVLRGPEGLGHLVLRPDEIAFNGNTFLGQAGDEFSIERHARHGVIARRSYGGSRRTVRRCDTRGHAYDLAVCAVLLVVERHLGAEMRLGTSGSLRTGWGRAATLVRETVGDAGQLVQHENGLLRWVDAPALGARRSERSSAS
jgi:hypothetical protein